MSNLSKVPVDDCVDDPVDDPLATALTTPGKGSCLRGGKYLWVMVPFCVGPIGVPALTSSWVVLQRFFHCSFHLEMFFKCGS